MSDINKFFDDKSEHNTSTQSVMHKKLHTDIGQHRTGVNRSSKMFD